MQNHSFDKQTEDRRATMEKIAQLPAAYQKK